MQNRSKGLVYFGLVLLLIIMISGISSGSDVVLNGEESEETTPPLPEIDSVVVEPLEGVYEGETATIEVSVINNGGSSNEGYISISFPNNEEVIDVSGTGNGYNKLYPIGSTLHSEKGAITSVNPVAGLSDSSWESGQTESLTIKVKPNAGSSKIVFYVRAALRDNSGSFVRVPSSSGDMDQEGWYVSQHSIDVIESFIEQPSPEISNVDYEGVYEGETATIEVSVINNGGPSNEGYISLSFPKNEEVIDVSGTGNEYNKLYPIGSTLHSEKGAITSVNPVAGLSDSSWESGQTESLTIKVKPNAGSSNIVFYVRAALRDNSGSFVRVPSSSGDMDQEGWYVESNSIDVLSSVDLTPPESVTKLKPSDSGHTSIKWTWTNPSDADFSHVMVYIDGVFVTTTSNNYYELTGLTEGSTHTIGLQTVDTAGNINPETVKDEATTSTTLPEITNVKAEDTTTSSIKLAWKASSDTTRVEIFRNTLLIGDVSSTFYVDSGLDSGTSYSYKLVPYNSNGQKGNPVNFNLKTSSSTDIQKGDDTTTSTNPSRRVTAEDPVNVALKDVASEYLTQNSNALYEFSLEGNDIQLVSFDSLKNSGQITSTVEVLNGRSNKVTSDPTGFVYKYINIWVGEDGFATTSNFQNAKIKFKVDSSWLEAMGFNSENVKLQVYSGEAWQELSTTLDTNNGEYSVFEAQTTFFGPFAITAEEKILPSPPGPDDPIPPEPNPGYIWKFFKVFILIGIVAVGYSYLKRD